MRGFGALLVWNLWWSQPTLAFLGSVRLRLGADSNGFETSPGKMETERLVVQ